MISRHLRLRTKRYVIVGADLLWNAPVPWHMYKLQKRIGIYPPQRYREGVEPIFWGFSKTFDPITPPTPGYQPIRKDK